MFERNLTDPVVGGTIHEVVEIIHRRETMTSAAMVDHSGNGELHTSRHEFPLDFDMTFEQAEQMVMELPEYAEAEPEQTLVERMRAMLTPEQLAELGLGE